MKNEKRVQMHTELYNRNVRIFEKEHRGTCTKCNKKIADGETIHLGYDKQYELAYVCDNCSKNLATIIVRHLYKKELYIKPNNKAKLWRFMDLAKYISLIQSKSLFFARADTFEDPFECAKGYKNLEYKWNACYAGFCWGAITSLENLPDIKKTYSEKEALTEANRLLKQLKDLSRKERQNTFICCWHENEFESEAMWKLYSNNSSQGVAIQTTYERLYMALDKDPDIDIGKINYIDFENHLCGVNGSFWYKRKSFEHEKEVRAVVELFPKKELVQSVMKPINLDVLIENIYVSPTSPKWFRDLVIDINIKYGVEKEVFHSTLDKEPFY